MRPQSPALPRPDRPGEGEREQVGGDAVEVDRRHPAGREGEIARQAEADDRAAEEWSAIQVFHLGAVEADPALVLGERRDRAAFEGEIEAPRFGLAGDAEHRRRRHGGEPAHRPGLGARGVELFGESRERQRRSTREDQEKKAGGQKWAAGTKTRGLAAHGQVARALMSPNDAKLPTGFE